MMANEPALKVRPRARCAIGGVAGLVVIACVVPARDAQAYIGESFLEIPGARGGWRGGEFRNWLRIESHYWQNDNFDPFGPRGTGALRRQRNFFSGPVAPPKARRAWWSRSTSAARHLAR